MAHYLLWECERGLSKLIVAIPAFNEEAVLPRVLKNLKRNLSDEEDSLILVVNDGSTDKTSEVAIKSGADIVVNHHQNLGVAQAIRTAIRTGLAFGAATSALAFVGTEPMLERISYSEQEQIELIENCAINLDK